MAYIQIAAVKEGFLVNSFVKKLQAQGYEVKITGMSPSEIALEKGAPDLFFLFSGEDIDGWAESLEYLAGMARELHFPFFALTGDEDDAFVRRFLGEDVVTRFVSRPFNVAIAVEEICDYLDAENAGERNRILVVDDSGVMLRNIKGWLEDKYSVTLCDSGRKALEYLKCGERPDLILLDYSMPEMDGIQVLEEIRGNNLSATIPVIFLTGRNDSESIKMALRHKTDGYLLKSMPAQEILDQVNRFFENNINKVR